MKFNVVLMFLYLINEVFSFDTELKRLSENQKVNKNLTLDTNRFISVFYRKLRRLFIPLTEINFIL